MWFSVALAGLEVLGAPAFRAPDGIVDAAVGPDGRAWAISEHGEFVGFDRQGEPIAQFQACETRSVHTDLQLSPGGNRIGADCGALYRVFELPSGSLAFEVPLQTAKAQVLDEGLIVLGEEYVDDATAEVTAIHQFDAKGLRVAKLDGDFLDVIWANGLVALERRVDEDDVFAGLGLTRIGEERLSHPIVYSGPADTPPQLSSRGGIACLTLNGSGWCQDARGESVRWGRADEPFIAPEQEVPVCNADRSVCYDVDRVRFRRLGASAGIGRIEAVAANANGKHFLTRDHLDQVLHHSDKGRRLLTTTDGDIAISPSGRFAWYQTAQRSMRVELINGVRATFPRATAAVFDHDDALWLAVPSGGTTMISKVPANLEVPMPVLPLDDPREITGLQHARLGNDKRATLLLACAEDDEYALLDLPSGTLGAGPKRERKPWVAHAFSPSTPVHLGPRGVYTVDPSEEGLTVKGPGNLDLQASPEAFVRMGGISGGVVEGAEASSFMGTARRGGTLPGPVFDAWMTDHALYVSLRDGRLGILK